MPEAKIFYRRLTVGKNPLLPKETTYVAVARPGQPPTVVDALQAQAGDVMFVVSTGEYGAGSGWPPGWTLLGDAADAASLMECYRTARQDEEKNE